MPHIEKIYHFLYHMDTTSLCNLVDDIRGGTEIHLSQLNAVLTMAEDIGWSRSELLTVVKNMLRTRSQ